MSPSAGLLLTLLFPLSAAAAEPASLLACRSIASDVARVACYDRVVDRAQARLAPGDADTPLASASSAVNSVADDPGIDKRSRSLGERWFGRSGAEDDRALRSLYGVEEVAVLVAEVAAIRKASDHTFEITLANGQSWRQKEAAPFPLHVGDSVHIQEGTFGVYYLRRVEGGRTISVKRTN